MSYGRTCSRVFTLLVDFFFFLSQSECVTAAGCLVRFGVAPMTVSSTENPKHLRRLVDIIIHAREIVWREKLTCADHVTTKQRFGVRQTVRKTMNDTDDVPSRRRVNCARQAAGVRACDLVGCCAFKTCKTKVHV